MPWRRCTKRGRAQSVVWTLEPQAVHVDDARLAFLDAQDVAGLVAEYDGLLVGQVDVVEDRVEGDVLPGCLSFFINRFPLL